MRIKERIEGDVAVLELRGSLIVDATAVDQFQDRLHGLKTDRFNKVVLDLGGVTLMNSAGVGMLIAGAKTLRAVGGDLRMANLQDRPHRILETARLVAEFKIFETADRAVASFAMDK